MSGWVGGVGGWEDTYLAILGAADAADLPKGALANDLQHLVVLLLRGGQHGCVAWGGWGG